MQRATQPAAMEPLMPDSHRVELDELTHGILRQAGQLAGQLPAAIVRTRIARLVREMNSYYSNLIEGHKTLPHDIEGALQQNYSRDPEKRANQHLTRAHIEVEELMIGRLESEPQLSIHSPEFLGWLHGEFYRRLPEELHFSTNREGKTYRIEPGTLRSFEVNVGRHQPPQHGALKKFLDRFAAFYGDTHLPPGGRLIALAAAHHRLAWIHPFGDGNGRVTRLYSHAGLIRNRIDGFGLWTISRGLARQRAEFYQQLSGADASRRNDHDGRGQLSDKALAAFVRFFLRLMLDQIEFMGGLLQLSKLGLRIERHLQFELLQLKPKTRERLARLLQAALMQGEIQRGAVSGIVGVGDTEARKIIRLALTEKLLDSPSAKGSLSLLFSARTLESYFPQLYQDLPVEPVSAVLPPANR